MNNSIITMKIQQRNYPIGIQTFERIIKEGYVYVDKTDMVWELAHSSPFVFLSRPRRFGKSLLSTTLVSYFKGERDLFDGLKMMELEQEWKEYPVIHLDLSTAKNKDDVAKLQNALSSLLEPYQEMFGTSANEDTPGAILKGCITRAYKKTGCQVVVIIDEYDSPLLDMLHEQEYLAPFKKTMQEFYQPLKACESMIRFCFITGITKFSQLSIFSTLNNLSNVSLRPEYATICGITERELTTSLNDDIDMMAQANNCSNDEMHQRLKLQYDGYHFAKKSEEVYNPYSLFSCFTEKEVKNYWFESGTPSFLFHQIRRFGTDITKMDEIVVPESDFNLSSENLSNALPLLYQSGYLTIKDYDPDSEAYRLSIPNQEVRIGFAKGLLPFYTGLVSGDVQLGCAYKMWVALRKGDVNQALEELKAFLAGVPYVEGFKQKLADAATKEGFYEYTFYLILSMLNVYVQTQVKCRNGRTDMIVNTMDTIYVFEFKVKGSAEKALLQIDEKGYTDRYATDNRKVVSVGVNFNIVTWNIENWIIK